MLTKLFVPYDLCVGVRMSCLLTIRLTLDLQSVIVADLGEGPSMGLLRYCEIFAKLRLQL